MAYLGGGVDFGSVPVGFGLQINEVLVDLCASLCECKLDLCIHAHRQLSASVARSNTLHEVKYDAPAVQKGRPGSETRSAHNQCLVLQQ